MNNTLVMKAGSHSAKTSALLKSGWPITNSRKSFKSNQPHSHEDTDTHFYAIDAISAGHRPHRRDHRLVHHESPQTTKTKPMIGPVHTLLLATLALYSAARAQDMEPRSYSNSPTGLSFAIGG
jgi:hypothetical protein